MDFETQRKKRMDALEDKRRRLEEMRKSRKERTDAVEEVQDSHSQADERAKVDDLVNSLLISTISEPIDSPSIIDLVSPRYSCTKEPDLFIVPDSCCTTLSVFGRCIDQAFLGHYFLSVSS